MRDFNYIVESYRIYCINKANAHYRVAEHHRKKHRFGSGLATGLTALVGTSVFASILKGDDGSQLHWVAAALSVLAVVVTALHGSLQFGEIYERHRSVAARYGAIRRSLEILALKYPDATGKADEPATTELEAIKLALDELSSEAPSIPDRDYDAVAKPSPDKNAPVA